MLSRSALLLRQGKKRPSPKAFGNPFRREPSSMKPSQGGQQMFEQLMLEKANRQAKDVMGDTTDRGGSTSSTSAREFLDHVRVPALDVVRDRYSGEERILRETEAQRDDDVWKTRRGYNALEWTTDRTAAARAEAAAAAGDIVPTEAPMTEANAPARIIDNQVFQEKHGYSLLKSRGEASKFNRGTVAYNELDLWAELPRYTPEMFFLYVITRRRNTYAVMYNHKGLLVHPVMTAGNLKLKDSDRGWRAEGSADYGNQVTSKYLDAAYPKCVSMLSEAGHPNKTNISIVVRVMGFYNGRQGAMKAITDRKHQYDVRYLEDVTPVPRNGPKMPKLHIKNK
eukprot:PhM_4_TR14362/c0_g1_i1/m.41726